MKLLHAQPSGPRYALARSLCESNVQFNIEDTWPVRQRAGGQHGEKSLRMGVTAGARGGGRLLFGSHPRRKDKVLLLDITIVNPCVSTSLVNDARRAGKQVADAVTSPTQLSSGRNR